MFVLNRVVVRHSGLCQILVAIKGRPVIRLRRPRKGNLGSTMEFSMKRFLHWSIRRKLDCRDSRGFLSVYFLCGSLFIRVYSVKVLTIGRAIVCCRRFTFRQIISLLYSLLSILQLNQSVTNPGVGKILCSCYLCKEIIHSFSYNTPFALKTK